MQPLWLWNESWQLGHTFFIMLSIWSPHCIPGNERTVSSMPANKKKKIKPTLLVNGIVAFSKFSVSMVNQHFGKHARLSNTQSNHGVPRLSTLLSPSIFNSGTFAILLMQTRDYYKKISSCAVSSQCLKGPFAFSLLFRCGSCWPLWFHFLELSYGYSVITVHTTQRNKLPMDLVYWTIQLCTHLELSSLKVSWDCHKHSLKKMCFTSSDGRN